MGFRDWDFRGLTFCVGAPWGGQMPPLAQAFAGVA